MANISNEDLKWLLELLEQEGLAEVEIGIGEDRVLLKNPTSAALVSPLQVVAAAPLAAPLPAPAAPPEPENGEKLLAPMAGIFYRAASPETPPFVEPGDGVHVGDTIGLIEAMKLYNEVTSHVNGRIIKFLVDNEAHVEADQPLVLIERFHS